MSIYWLILFFSLVHLSIIAIVIQKFSNHEKVKDIFGVATAGFKIKKEGPSGLPHLAFLEYFL